MLKNIKYLIIAIITSQTLAFASYNDYLIADIQYDWIQKSKIEKESIVSEIQDILFQNDFAKQDKFRARQKAALKDKNWKEHYYVASAGRKEYKDYNISAFYKDKSKYIYMYALQNKENPNIKYYYDAMGHLRYVDYLTDDYPDYPYCAYQYSVSGKPVSAIYYVSKENQYMFNPDKSFKGVWYKHNMYDDHSKIILKRTSY